MNGVESRKLEDVQCEEGITGLVHRTVGWNVKGSWTSDSALRPRQPFILCICKDDLGILTGSLVSAGLCTLWSSGLQ